MEILEIPVCGEDKKATKQANMREMVYAKFEKPPTRVQLKFIGEASYNQSIISFLAMLKREEWDVSPYISTFLPRSASIRSFLSSAINILNEDYRDNKPEFEWKIISTSEAQRKRKIGEVISLVELGKLVEKFPCYKPGKIILAFSLDADIDVSKVRNIFDPSNFAIRLDDTGCLPLGAGDLRKEFTFAGYDIK